MIEIDGWQLIQKGDEYKLMKDSAWVPLDDDDVWIGMKLSDVRKVWPYARVRRQGITINYEDIRIQGEQISVAEFCSCDIKQLWSFGHDDNCPEK